MSEVRITGRLIVKNDQKSVGTNGFIIREFVIETMDQYPQKIPMQLIKDNVSLLDQYQIGQEITALVNINGREYDKQDGSGKGYFLSLTAWKLEGPQVAPAQPQQGGGDGF